MAQRQPINIQFPLKGINEQWAFGQQPQGTTPAALNVRPYDVFEGRLRGGQRPGHTKYFTSAVNGVNPIQAIDQVTRAYDPAALGADTLLFSDDFTYGDGILPATHWYSFSTAWSWGFTDGALATDVTRKPYIRDNVVDGRDDPTGIGTDFVMIKDAIAPGNNYVIRWAHIATNTGLNTSLGAVIRAGDPSGAAIAAEDYGIVGVREFDSADPGEVIIEIGTDVRTTVDLSTDLGYPNDFWTTGHTVEVRVVGNHISLWIDNVKVIEKVTVTLSGNIYIGFSIYQQGANADWQWDDFEVYTGIVPASARTTTLVAISGGRTYGAEAGGDLSESVTETVDFATTKRVGTQEVFQKLYICDGIGGNYHIYDPATHAVGEWASTDGIIPVGALVGTTAYTIDNVNVGTKTFTISGDGDLSAEFPDDGHFVIAGSTGNDGAYQIASTGYGAPNFTIIVTQAIPSAVVDGTISYADVGCNLIALYRGRVVLSGLQTDPHNWFMSAVNDPLDWDYNPATPSQTQAVAGTSTDAGKLGDVVTALAPYSDDLMVMGGDHTLWVMRGDPAAGGTIDNISYQTGIAGPEAFTWDPEGNFYFFGAGSLWRMGAGITSIENISRGRMDTTFGEINYATHNVRLLWDDGHKGLHIYLTPNTEPAESPSHYYWDARTDGYWQDEMPTAQGPTAIHLFNADDPDDRAVLLGGFDSYIRNISDYVYDDDGIAIGSYVFYAPIMPWGPLVEGRLIELNASMSIDSGPAVIIVSSGPSAEYAVLEGATRYIRVVQPGQNAAMRQRVSGTAFMVRIAGRNVVNESWAIETLTGLFIPGGRSRRHGAI